LDALNGNFISNGLEINKKVMIAEPQQNDYEPFGKPISRTGKKQSTRSDGMSQETTDFTKQTSGSRGDCFSNLGYNNSNMT
jgi:hypothetical protein